MATITIIGSGSLVFTPFGAPVHRPTLQAHVRHAPFGLFPFEFTIRDQIPGYHGGTQEGRWFLGRADQFEAHGDEMWLLGNSRVPVWIFSHEPLEEAVFWVRSAAPGNRVRLTLPGDEAVLEFGDEPAPQTATLRPTGPSRVRHEEGREDLVYDFTVEAERGWSTRRFHLGAAIAHLGEAAGLERDVWGVEWFECSFPATVEAGGEPFNGTVRLRNTSGETWPSGPGRRLKPAYHWLDESGEPVVFEGARSAFARPVKPGRGVRLEQQVLPPDEPGRYILQLDLVYEFVGWFSERGAPTCEAEVEVLPAPGDASLSQSAR